MDRPGMVYSGVDQQQRLLDGSRNGPGLRSLVCGDKHCSGRHLCLFGPQDTVLIPSRVLKNPPTIPLTPFPSAGSGQALARKGEEFVSEGHPFGKLRAGSQTPGKGASPICTPLFPQPARDTSSTILSERSRPSRDTIIVSMSDRSGSQTPGPDRSGTPHFSAPC